MRTWTDTRKPLDAFDVALGLVLIVACAACWILVGVLVWLMIRG